MTKRRPPRLEREPPWMRLGPAADAADEGDDGERLWKRVADGVTPLGKSKHKRHAAPAPLGPQASRTTSGAVPSAAPVNAGRDDTRPAQAAKRRAALAGPPPLTPGRFVGLDRGSGEKLRRGKMPVDAKLDLHGMTQHEAHGAVTGFIRTQQANGARCVLIVTGKGGGLALAVQTRFTLSAGRGVLKDALPRWLNEPGLRPYILALSPARPHHGGAGAVYVLLKRKR